MIPPTSAPLGALIMDAPIAVAISYICRRSSDGNYIARAEMLAQSRPAALLTFDQDMGKQPARNAPAVHVRLLTI